MQFYILLVFVVILSVVFAEQSVNALKYAEANDNGLIPWKRYFTNKRAINGELRRSSIHWGKRALPNDTPYPFWSDVEKSESQENEQPVKSTNPIIHRVAKAGIRPKLALSSRLWGR